MNLFIVTGASRGLGLAMVRALAADPDNRIVAVSRSGVSSDTQILCDVHADLATTEGQSATVAQMTTIIFSQPWQRAVLINNAGVLGPFGAEGRVDVQELQHCIAVNLTAAIVLMNAFLVASAAILGRSVINISSGSGRRPIAGTAAYCATKAGLDMASRVAALECEAAVNPVTITSLAPGIIDTDMQVDARSADEAEFPDVARFRAFKSEGLLKTPDEVALRIIALDRDRRLPAGIADIREIG